MRDVDIERINREFEDIGITHGIEVFYINTNYILHKDLIEGINSILKDINCKIDRKEKVTKDEAIKVLEDVDNYLIKFNETNIRNRGGYGIQLEYSLSILTIILKVRYFSPAGNVYYIDNEHSRVLSLYKKECDEGINTTEVLEEYIQYYSKESEGRVKYILNNDNNLEAITEGLDIEKIMDTMNLLADSTLDDKRKDKVNIDNIIYRVGKHTQYSKVSLPRDYKIISFKILTNNLELNLQDMKSFEVELIDEALNICIQALTEIVGIYQRDIANHGMERKDSLYDLDELDKINILKNTVLEIANYQRKVFDYKGSDFIIDIENTFILQVLYKGLISVRYSMVKEMAILNQQICYCNGKIEYKEKLDMINRKFDFCTKVIETLEPKYKNLNESELIRGL